MSKNKRKMTILGKIMYYSGTFKMYKNGDGVGIVWRYYNPITWVMIPIILLLTFLETGTQGWPGGHELGFTVDPYFKKNPDKLEWI